MLVSTVLLSVACIVLGAQSLKPFGWVAVGLGILAILSACIHWPR